MYPGQPPDPPDRVQRPSAGSVSPAGVHGTCIQDGCLTSQTGYSSGQQGARVVDHQLTLYAAADHQIAQTDNVEQTATMRAVDNLVMWRGGGDGGGSEGTAYCQCQDGSGQKSEQGVRTSV